MTKRHRVRGSTQGVHREYTLSRIYFHEHSGTAEVLGSERAYAGQVCADLGRSVLGVHGFVLDISRYRAMLPDGAFPLMERDDSTFMRHLGVYLSGSGDGRINVPGAERTMETWLLGLNTAVAMGNDALILLAKIHAQCEMHGYVEGPNRAWLATIIEQGLETHVLRDKVKGSYSTGWRDVVELLGTRDDVPVVTSYSVTEQFPNAYVAGWHDDHDGDDWYELSEDERWARALVGLRSGDFGEGLEWSPETWHNGFGETPAYSAFDFIAAWSE